MKTLIIAVITALAIVGCGTTPTNNIDPATLAAIEALALQYATSGKIDQASAIYAIERLYPNLDAAQIAAIVTQVYGKHPTPRPSPAPNHTPTPQPNHTPTPHK